MYAKQTYVGLRASIHRHSTGEPFHRQINIIQDREFQAANHVFLGMLRKMKKDGLDRSKSKSVIKPGDMEKIKQSNVLSSDNPQALQRLVWFNITFFFVDVVRRASKI